jgi:hypothetical protein
MPTSAPRQAARVWPSRTGDAITGDGASWTWDRHDLQTVLADLDCDSVRTPVALDRDGNVWYLPVWPDDATGVATLLTTVPGAQRLDVERGRCDQLVVVTADGPVRPAAPGAARPRSPGDDPPA